MKRLTLLAMVMTLLVFALPDSAFAENIYGGQVPMGPCDDEFENPCGTGPVDCSDADPATWAACINAFGFPIGVCEASEGTCAYNQAEPCATYRVCSARIAKPSGGGWICANCSDQGKCEIEGCNYNL